MRVLIFKWGDGFAIRLPKAISEGLGVTAGDAVELAVAGAGLTIRTARPRYRLENLVAGITADYRPEAVEFPPAGREKL